MSARLLNFGRRLTKEMVNEIENRLGESVIVENCSLRIDPDMPVHEQISKYVDKMGMSGGFYMTLPAIPLVAVLLVRELERRKINIAGVFFYADNKEWEKVMVGPVRI